MVANRKLGTEMTEKQEKRVVSRTVAIALGITCIILAVVLVGTVAYIMPMIKTKNNIISSQNSAITNLQNQMNQLQKWLNGNVTAYNNYLDNHSYTNEQYASAYIKGFYSGYKEGLTSRGFNIGDPTYQQMLSFMATDTVHDNTYSSNYTCFNFASDFANEAFNNGYRCGLVYITFTDGTAHMIDCFNSTDKGLFLIEPQTDTIVSLTVGQLYQISASYLPLGIVDYYDVIW
jgi:hypothetical protein